MKMGYTRTSCLFVCCFVWLFVVLFVCLFVCLFDFCHKNDLNYKLNILGPLCLWQCLYLHVWFIGISFLISLNNSLFKNIQHVGAFWYFVICCICVFVYLCICIFVFACLINGNIIFDILEQSSFQKYTTCWVFLVLCHVLYLCICVFVCLYLCICVLDTWQYQFWYPWIKCFQKIYGLYGLNHHTVEMLPRRDNQPTKQRKIVLLSKPESRNCFWW